MGRMKKIDTSSLVNWAMCEAANTAALHDPRMEAVYTAARRRHADRHAPAVVVVANKMITIAWHMFKNGGGGGCTIPATRACTDASWTG